MFIITVATVEMWNICVAINISSLVLLGSKIFYAGYTALIPSNATVYYRIHSTVCRKKSIETH
jgi:hypothetical protein